MLTDTVTGTCSQGDWPSDGTADDRVMNGERTMWQWQGLPGAAIAGRRYQLVFAHEIQPLSPSTLSKSLLFTLCACHCRRFQKSMRPLRSSTQPDPFDALQFTAWMTISQST
jgi:hypothetical protein